MNLRKNIFLDMMRTLKKLLITSPAQINIKFIVKLD